jgi:hypothetical protein
VSELRESLDEALRTVTAGDPPVEETIRRGKSIRMRRRVAAIASVAAVAVLAGVGYPAVTHLGAAPAPAPATHRHISVTVLPPGRGSLPGEIAHGVINGRAWELTTSNPRQDGSAGQCLMVAGAAFGPGTQSCGPVPAADSADPVNFEGFEVGQSEANAGPVAANVSYALVRLSDGTTLKLTPVRVYGTRYVAFAVPTSLSVESATAYLTNGRYLTSIPFNPPGEMPDFVTWLAPGQPVAARVSKLIGSGSSDGTTWSVRAYAGPWGICFVGTDDSFCTSGGAAGVTRTVSSPGDSPGVVVGTAAPGVRYIMVTMTDGSTLRVTPVAVGGQQYFGFYLSKGQQTVRKWTAYDAAGKELSAGTLG